MTTPLPAGVRLTGHQYGKSENHVVRVRRETARHEIKDVTVSTTLRGAFEAAYLEGDQSAVLPTDTQKNTVFAYAKTQGLTTVEDYALALARHFVDDVAPVTGARVEVEEHTWTRALVGEPGQEVEHDHTWTRSGADTRTAAVTAEAGQAWVVGGLADLVLLKSTGSQFRGFLTDELTTLEETDDRVMATSLLATWRFAGTDAPADGWDATYARIRHALVGTFATLHSLALQQTLWQMGNAVLGCVPEVVEVRMSAPNRHHFRYDLERFGIENAGEVFHADDRPYGLIHAAVAREDAPPAGPAWDAGAGRM